MRKRIFLLLFLAANSPLFSQKNVILIIADDLGTDYCGFSEDAQDTAKMPNVRSLLSRGVRFSNAWSNPICSPARASILTGRHAFRTGVGTVITGAANGQLDTAEITLGKILKKASPTPFNTANIGKWHLHISTSTTRNYPAVLGYDHYAGNFIGQVNDYYNWTKIVDGAAPVTITNYATTEQVDDAIDWLNQLDLEKPFFLWQAFNAPHFPFHLPPANLHTVPGLTGTQQDIMAHRSEYFKAMIESMDTEIGRLFAWLDAHNVRDSTTIIFVGDNGNDERIAQIPNPSHSKGTIYEYGIHVPYIISGPTVQSPGRVSDALINAPDLFPTILELAGIGNWKNYIPANKTVDGLSLLPILKNEASSVHDWIFSEIFDPNPLPENGKTARDKDYKLLRFDDGHDEFYKISSDVWEQDNLWNQIPDNPEYKAHYLFLCAKMSALLGTQACKLNVNNTEPAASLLSLSPNPASNEICLNDEEDWTSVEIFNAQGQLALQLSRLKDNKIVISTLPSGLYVIKARNQQAALFTGKFIK